MAIETVDCLVGKRQCPNEVHEGKLIERSIGRACSVSAFAVRPLFVRGKHLDPLFVTRQHVPLALEVALHGHPVGVEPGGGLIHRFYRPFSRREIETKEIGGDSANLDGTFDPHRPLSHVAKVGDAHFVSQVLANGERKIGRLRTQCRRDCQGSHGGEHEGAHATRCGRRESPSVGHSPFMRGGHPGSLSRKPLRARVGREQTLQQEQCSPFINCEEE